MRRARLLAGVVVASLVAAALVADGGSAQETAPQPRTLELSAVHAGGFRVDNRPRGASAGDLLGFRETLTADGRRVGREHGTCIAVTRTLADCTVTTVLAGGTIVGRFTQDLTKQTIMAAVVGGTGDYRVARGEATVTLGERANRIVFRLVD